MSSGKGTDINLTYIAFLKDFAEAVLERSGPPPPSNTHDSSLVSFYAPPPLS